MKRPAPPSGREPPTRAVLEGGEPIDLVPLAEEVCSRYFHEFPEDRGRYGDAGGAWCVHDNQHILNWAVLARGGFVDLERELAWLARVLDARDFPLEHLVRDVEIAGEVVGERLGAAGRDLAADLAAAAAQLRS